LKRAALNLAARTLWRMPGCFSVARLLGPGYCLRSVLFHDISERESPFTKGLGITITPDSFGAVLRFLIRNYNPVGLEDVLAASNGAALPDRPVLVTFDDGYASVCDFAVPLCRKFGVPAISFINASCIDNRQLALDNLVCYVANVLGMGTINAAVRCVDGIEHSELRSLNDVFTRFLPSISLSARSVFRDALVRFAGICESDLARGAGLYVSSQQLRGLAAFDFEIGNHTYTHVNCRRLAGEDLSQEIDRNKTVLEAISGRRVRSFSVPYGSSVDLTREVGAHLEASGHKAVFLVESLANRQSGRIRLYRVSISAAGDASLFSEIEVLPRLRAIRNRLFAATILKRRFGVTQAAQ